MKKVSYLFLVLLLLITGLVNVNADEYASYRKGDRITVILNDSTSKEFYVIEDSGNDKEKVTAIYAEVFENKYSYESANDYIDTLEEEWSNVDSISIPSMEDIFGSDVELEEGFKFTKPSWALSDYSYWTSTETEVGDELWVWTVGGIKLDGEGSAGIAAATSENYLKPLINVPKSSVAIAQDKPIVGDESKEDSPQTGDMDLLLFGGAIALFFGLTVVSFKKTRTN